MKYASLLIVVFAMLGVLVYGELNFDSPDERARMAQIAEQTLFIIGTAEGTREALQSTIDAAAPVQTQFSAELRRQDFLSGTRDALISGTVNVPVVTATPQPVQIPAASNAPVIGSIVDNNYADITIAGDITDEGCAADRTNNFVFSSPTEGPEIYVVTRALDVTAGTTFQTRWYANSNPSQAYESISWTADTGYPTTCVYFWMEPSDIPYSMGVWTVELIVNSSIVQTLTFNLCDLEMAAECTT